MKLLLKILTWSDEKLWHSWVVHLGAAVLLAIPFGGRVAGVSFTLREGEQLFHAKKVGKFEKWYDYPMDLVGPLLVWYLWPY